MMSRTCARPGCGREIPSVRRADAMYCEETCAAAVRRARHAGLERPSALPDFVDRIRAARRRHTAISGRMRDRARS